MNIAEITVKNLEYYINLIDEIVVGFGKINSERVLGWKKCYQTALYVTEKYFVKGRIN